MRNALRNALDHRRSIPYWAAFTSVLFTAACHDPQHAPAPPVTTAEVHSPNSTSSPDSTAHVRAAEPISQYIRRMLQDRDGNLWFGTTSDGMVRYNGKDLEYHTPANGFGSNWVSSMVQDATGSIWFGTGGGVSRTTAQGFRTYTTEDGLPSDQVWCLLLDRSGVLWAGTENGVSRFDGARFIPFPIPAADLSKFPYYRYPKQINWMIQDREGNIWFASNGGGAYKYDGHSLSNLTEKDGLCNNFVETVLEDKAGNIWFGTRYGGLCKYHPSALSTSGSTSFTTFTRNDLRGDHIWTLYQTMDGTLWIAVAKVGLCRYDGTSFTCYDERDGAGIRVVQSLFEDNEGQLWVGTSEGVYRHRDGYFTAFSKEDALSGRYSH